MRISEDQICARISEMLKEKGFNVVASEVVEGYKKPAVFVNCSPASIELLNRDVEEVTDTIEIKYIPKIETVSHCSKDYQEYIHVQAVRHRRQTSHHTAN